MSHEDEAFCSQVVAAIDKYVPVDRPPVVVHVGCLDAFEIGYVASHKACGRVIGIDADPASGNPKWPGTEFKQVLIAKETGSRTFNIRAIGLSSMTRTGKPQVMDCMSLDDFCGTEKIDAMDVLIIDVEGSSDEVILGAERMLKSCSLVVAETQFTALAEGEMQHDLFVDMMKERGFSVLDGYGYKNVDQTNTFFVKDGYDAA